MLLARALAALVLASVVGSGAGARAGARPGADPETHTREASTEADEYRVKAAFLYHFVYYTTWPPKSFADDAAPIVLLIVGEDPFGPVLDATFEGKKLHDREVVVRRVEEVPKEVEAHVVFVGDATDEERAALLDLCRERPVLLVGEHEGFAEDGARCNFYLEDEKVRFEVNVGEAQECGLALSSQLLKLARIVETKEERR